MKSYLSLLLLVSLFLLVGCGATPTEQNIVGAGAPSPQAVVESFLEDLNHALGDAKLAQTEVRQLWAERLAGHFAPSERVDQRTAMADLLDGFAASAAKPALGSKATLEITYRGTEVLTQRDGRALVQVVDGVFTLRFLDTQGVLVRERTGSLSEVLGQTSGGLPTLQVGGSWFMTEGF